MGPLPPWEREREYVSSKVATSVLGACVESVDVVQRTVLVPKSRIIIKYLIMQLNRKNVHV